MGNQQQVILVMEGACASGDNLQALLARDGRRVVVVHDPSELLIRVSRSEVGAVVFDLEDVATDGVELLRRLRDTSPRRLLPVLVVDQTGDRSRRLGALRQGAADVLQKPVDADELRVKLDRSLEISGQFEELRHEAEHLHTLSVTDGLTRAHNHRFFKERLREEFRRSQRYDAPLSLMLLDVDHFKDVNDRYGHVVGDEVLCDVADAIRASIRDTDLLARYGGEEFAVLLPNTRLGGALTVAERVWRGIWAVAAGPARELRITASIGLSAFPGRSVVSPEQLLCTADEALYRAKHEGRNRICLYPQASFFAEPSAG